MSFRPLGRIIRPLVALVLSAYVLWKAHPSAVLDAAAATDLRWVGLAIALVVVDRVLMAYRWIVLLCPIEASARPPLRSVLRVFFVSTFLGTFLPASIGGDLVRTYSLARLQVARGQALASVLMDRMLGVMSIVIVGIAGLWVADRTDLVSVWSVWFSLSAASALSAVMLTVVFSGRAADAAQRLTGWLPVATVRHLAEEGARATRAYSQYHGPLANVLAGSVTVQLLRIAQAYCLGQSLGMLAPWTAYLAFIPMILLVMLLPVTVNGIGTSQVAFVWFFERAGTPAPEALALSVLFLGLGVIGNLPGGLIYAFDPSPKAAKP